MEIKTTAVAGTLEFTVNSITAGFFPNPRNPLRPWEMTSISTFSLSTLKSG